MYSGTRKDLHRLMKADGWYLPSENSSILTIEFLRDVRSGKVLCPKTSDVRLRACAHPPKVETLISYLVIGLTSHFSVALDATKRASGANLVKLLEKKQPDR